MSRIVVRLKLSGSLSVRNLAPKPYTHNELNSGNNIRGWSKTSSSEKLIVLTKALT